MSFIYRQILFGLLLSFAFFNIYQHRKIFFPKFDDALGNIHEYITNFRSYIREKPISPRQPCKSVKNENNYDLSQYKYKCPHHRYVTRMIERSPLIIYIENFLTPNEIQHLIDLVEPTFKPSKAIEENGSPSVGDFRTSHSAVIKSQQTPVVTCIEQRFAQFQGDVEIENLEPLQAVKYISDQHYKPHYDWFPFEEYTKVSGQRVTSFFTYLQANCSMGETEFVNITFNATSHRQFCDILTCDENSPKAGIRFRPLPGNSIFWFNIDEVGEEDYMTYHAGRAPGKNGLKIGLNTWTRAKKYFPMPKQN
ncbi:unnamed protein product [Adineta ricciae]|uniref:Prolyl 4-hydroxylase alpha subunit domain-containing protein n=1 Tax=Adineta ricciae TaxID=249248 RepID=A0A814D6F5_ADIRI|nr:unnamed protein product [Adineta ricciae]CAF1267059.1 unnamed protein product [Adineta ricciae]